jgi:drug/metabolite transporter (DMT)-like permease
VNWITLTILSAILLGVYDIFKKISVHNNAVPIVLLASVCCGAVIWSPLMIWGSISPVTFPSELLRIQPLTVDQHQLVIMKSILVGASWSLAFAALKHLPLSLAGPIRSTSPLWTILIAVAFLNERPNAIQWLGIATVIGSFYAFSLVGKREGIRFHRDRWVWCMIAATLLGSLSSIYDKYLLQDQKIDAATLQAWFTVYLVPVMCPLAAYWFWHDRRRVPFQWRWTIPLIAIFLLTADFLYFTAVADPDAIISIVSPVRRSAIVIPFLLGILYFGEKNFRQKAICVMGLILGVVLIARGS